MTGPLILKDNPAEDLEAATKQYVDNHTSDVVLYTPQTLSDEQKARARGNIDAAPGGYGVGTKSKWLRSSDDLNNIYQGGFYYWYGDNVPLNIPAGANYGGMLVIARSQTEYVQVVYVIVGTLVSCNCELRRTAYNNVWYPWEWVNPPMEVGVEYRTTERYKGKPVYTQLMNFGNSPAKGTVKTVGMPPNSENQRLVWAQLTHYGITFPYYNNDNSIAMYIYVGQGSEKIYIHSPGDDRSDHGVIEALLKYTKNTD